MRKLPFLICFLFVAWLASAQRIENVRAAVNGDRVTVTYDIMGVPVDSKFRVQLFSSHNNFSAPLTRVTGDVGEVSAGPGKRVEWDARTELQTFSGDISFEVRGVSLAPLTRPLAFTNPTSGEKLTLGKNAEIRWTGGERSQNVRIELLRHGSVVQQVGSTGNSGGYSWPVPATLEKGEGYQFRLTAGAEAVTSQYVIVKKKMSPLIYAAPVVAAGIVVLLLSGGDDDGGGGNGGNGTVTDLPPPPDTP